MKLLQLHVDYIDYRPIEKEIEGAEASSGPKRVEDAVVCFVSVEEGDDDGVAVRAVEELKASMDELKASRLLIYPYAHLSNRLAPPSRALALLRLMEDKAKERGIEVHRAPFGWLKSFELKLKAHPLAERFKEIGGEAVPKALVAEEKLKSYWYIITPEELIPVDEFDFSNYGDLERLARYEMAKSRAEHVIPPHVELMKRLELADYEPGSDPGNMRYYPKGRLVKSLLEEYVTEKVVEYGGMEVETPVMYDSAHPSLSSYLNRFPARQYMVRSEGKELFLRFSACFGQFLMAKDAELSYRHMPVRLYELTRYSFRREKRGELSGLRRLRAFTMPDCHALCADMEQAKEEMVRRLKLSMEVLEGVGLGGSYELAIRFTKDFYEQNRDFVHRLVGLVGKPALAEMWEKRFFYFVLKWEFNFIDSLGRASALSTDQIDVENGERFGIKYVDRDNVKRSPIILHNSPSGAIERVMFALLEKAYKDMKEGKVPTLPTWLLPIQARVIPVSGVHLEYARKVMERLDGSGVRVDLDDREETLSKKVRRAEKEWVRYIVVVGEEEVKSGRISVRDRVKREVRRMGVEELIKEVKKEVGGKPFRRLPLPKLLSKRPTFHPL